MGSKVGAAGVSDGSGTLGGGSEGWGGGFQGEAQLDEGGNLR